MNTFIRHISVVAIVLSFAPATFGDVLVGSWAGDSIRRYDDTGTFLGDFVPSGTGGLDLPDGMDFGADGNLYVASSNSNEILRYDGVTGAFIDAFVNSGLNAPGNLQFGPDGFLYVCNKNTGQVLRFDPSSGSSTGVFASGGGLINPVGLLWDAGLLYVADFVGNAIRRYDATTGAYVDNFATVTSPLILNHDLNGNIMISSHNLDNVLRFATDGTALGSFFTGGAIDCPVGYVFDGQGEVIVASWQNHRLLRYDEQSGAYIGEFAIGDGLAQPNDVLIVPVQTQEVSPNSLLVTRGESVSGTIAELTASDNNDVVVRRRNSDVQSITQFEVEAASPFASLSQMAITLEGAVFARSTVNQTIELFDFSASEWEVIDERPASRFTDDFISVATSGDATRFVESGSQLMRARVTFRSVVARQQFSSNTDLFQWAINP